MAETLAYIWFALIGVLFIGYAIFDGFDLGVGVLYPFLGKTAEDKAIMRQSIGPIWDGNEVWLLTAGGALFAAFPPVYASVFSGFYLAMMLVLFGLIARAASLEFRGVDPKWSALWDWGFFGGSLVPALLAGVAVGNIIRGIPLTVDGWYAGTFFTLLNPYALIIGVMGLSWVVLHGASWLAVKTTGDLHKRAVSTRNSMLIIFFVLFLVATAATFLMVRGAFMNVVTNPVGWLFLVIAVAGVAVAYLMARGKKDRGAFYGSALIAVAAVGIWAMSIFPNMVPSLGPGGPLTITGSSSTQLTLTVMLIIALIGVPLVLFYFFLIYKTYAGKVELSSDSHY